MKFNHLLSLCLIFVLLTSSTFLTAQTYQQQQVSTRIITKMFDGKLKFNPKKTRRISSKQLKKIINSNTVLTSDLKKEVANNLIPKDASNLFNWHAIVAEFTAECEEVTPLVLTWFETENKPQVSKIYLFFPPNNKCGSVLARLYPIIYKDEYDWKNMNTFTTKQCINLGNGTICANLIIFSATDDPGFLATPDCEADSDCGSPFDYYSVLDDLFMVEGK